MLQQEVAEHAVKVAPPAAVASLDIAGLPMNEWVYILTAVYLIFQIVVIIPRAIKVFRR